MRCETGAFVPEHAERLTQLINKTNQFNLTTRRYTAAEVDHLMQDPASVTVFGRLIDKFGDNGIVSAMIGHIENDTCYVDLWIMSCRVFKRGLEDTMMDEFVRRSVEKGAKRIVGRYFATAKNLLTREIYATMGFSKTSETDTEAEFVLEDAASYLPRNHVMELERLN